MLEVKRIRQTMLALGAAAFAFPAIAVAQQTGQVDRPQTQRTTQTQVEVQKKEYEHKKDAKRMGDARHKSAQLLHSEKLIGQEVQDQQGEQVGTIREIVLDQRLEKAEYFVVATGGVLGVGEAYHAVPVHALRFEKRMDQATGIQEDLQNLVGAEPEPELVAILISGNAQSLEEMEGFDRDRWPNEASNRFGTPDAARFQGSGAIRDSQSMNRDARSSTTIQHRSSAAEIDEDMRSRAGTRIGTTESRTTRVDVDRRSQDGAQERSTQVGVERRSTQANANDRVPEAGIQRTPDQRVPEAGIQQRTAQDQRSTQVDVEQRTARDQRSTEVDVRERTTQDQRSMQAGAEQRDQGSTRITAEQRTTQAGADQQATLRSPHAREIVRPTIRSDDSEHFWLRKLSELVGRDVQSFEGEDIGTIKDVVIDRNEGRVAYALISLDGDDKVATAPWSAVELRPQQEVARIDANLERLNGIAVAEADLNLDDRGYATRVHEQFDRDPYWVVYGYQMEYQAMPGTSAQRHRDWQAQSEYLRNYKANEQRSYRGKIQSVSQFRPGSTGESDGLQLTVRTETDETLTVHAGPRDYSQQKGISFRNGDEISFTGNTATINGRQVVIAREITKGGESLELINDQGQPQWNDSQMDDRSGMDANRLDRDRANQLDRDRANQQPGNQSNQLDRNRANQQPGNQSDRLDRNRTNQQPGNQSDRLDRDRANQQPGN